MTFKLSNKLNFWYGFAFFVIINLIGGYGITLFVDIKQVYQTLNLPWFAPPVWLFGVAWTTNNICTIYGNILTYNLPKSQNRTTLLRLQILSWINFASFQYLSFGTGIASLYFWPTFSMLLINLFSIFYAYKLDTQDTSLQAKILSGKSIFMSLVSLVCWLLIASFLGYYIMILN
jgi:tryptophan-rich sensory protein